MRRSFAATRVGVALAAALVCATLTVGAQIEVGSPALKIEAKSLANTKIKSLASLRGRLILYDFFAYW
jgi:hypothetical protein